MLTLFSPAKINIFLKVLGKRDDGFHELVTLIQAIDLGDTLSFSLSDEDRLTCTDASIPCDGRNLVARAVDLFREKTGFSKKVSIHLEKKIPHEAGLGGGSSNAATALWAMNNLSGREVSVEQLMEWGGQLGSDVPFFLSTGTAYCTGRGEKIRSVTPPNRPPLTLVKPDLGLSTPKVFGALNIAGLVKREPEEMLEEFLEGQRVYSNDLEGAALSVAPELASLQKELLSRGFEDVVMTGSGSAFYCTGAGNTSGIEGKTFTTQYLNRTEDQWYSNE